MSSEHTAPSLNISTSRRITNRHFNFYISALIQILLGSSAAYFSPGLMLHCSAIIRELLFVKKYLTNKMNMTYLFEMKDESSSDGEPVLPKILTKIMEKDYKMKEMK